MLYVVADVVAGESRNSNESDSPAFAPQLTIDVTRDLFPDALPIPVVTDPARNRSA